MPTSYACAKCGHDQCDVAEIRATGGFWSKVFDIQNKRFTTVTCKQCTYTELFRASSSELGSIFDFFTG